MKSFLLILLLLGLLMGFWALFIEPQTLEVQTYKLKSGKLKGLKIAFASDMHIAPRHQRRLKRIVDSLNVQQADIIILGGDFVKGHKPSSSMPIDSIAACWATTIGCTAGKKSPPRLAGPVLLS